MTDFSTCANVLFCVAKACIGAGIYGYPHVFGKHGVIPVLITTILSGIAATLGTYSYITMNEKYKRKHSISTLGEVLISREFRYFIDIVVILKCLVVAAGYLNLATNLIEKIVPSIDFKLIQKNPELTSHCFIGLCSVLLIPCILARDLNSFKYFSYLGTFCILALILLSATETRGCRRRVRMVVSGPRSLLDNIGTFVFGFSCHQSILSIHNTTTVPESTFKYLVACSFVFVAALYILFGIINYSAFSGDGTAEVKLDQVFEKWDAKNTTTKLARGLFALSLIISVPYQLHAAKSHFAEIFKTSKITTSLAGTLMTAICYFMTTRKWYNFVFVSNYVTKPFNTLLCFVFPVIFMLSSRMAWTSIVACVYLVVFSMLCLASYFVPSKL